MATRRAPVPVWAAAGVCTCPKSEQRLGYPPPAPSCSQPWPVRFTHLCVLPPHTIFMQILEVIFHPEIMCISSIIREIFLKHNHSIIISKKLMMNFFFFNLKSRVTVKGHRSTRCPQQPELGWNQEPELQVSHMGAWGPSTHCLPGAVCHWDASDAGGAKCTVPQRWPHESISRKQFSASGHVSLGAMPPPSH